MTYDRDLIGYGENPPDPRWPDGCLLYTSDAADDQGLV